MNFLKNIKKNARIIAISTALAIGSFFSPSKAIGSNLGVSNENRPYEVEVIRGNVRTIERFDKIPEGSVEVVRGNVRTIETPYKPKNGEVIVINGDEIEIVKYNPKEITGAKKDKEKKSKGVSLTKNESYASTEKTIYRALENNMRYETAGIERLVSEPSKNRLERHIEQNAILDPLERNSHSYFELAATLIPLAAGTYLFKRKNKGERKFFTPEQEIQHYLNYYKRQNDAGVSIKSPVSTYRDKYNYVRYRNAKTGRFVKKETALEILSSSVKVAA